MYRLQQAPVQTPLGSLTPPPTSTNLQLAPLIDIIGTNVEKKKQLWTKQSVGVGSTASGEMTSKIEEIM